MATQRGDGPPPPIGQRLDVKLCGTRDDALRGELLRRGRAVTASGSLPASAQL